MDGTLSTKVTIRPLTESPGYHDKWMSLGSCFSDTIGTRLQQAGFSVCRNPFGVLFNPFSISSALKRLINNRSVTADELFQYGSLWNHFQFSNLYSGINLQHTISEMNNRITAAAEFLTNTSVLMITFGTSWIYEDKLSGTVVANCHKLPGNRFIRRRLTIAEIVNDFSELMHTLPGNQCVIFTVSPVRHWKDGAHENTLSKATLHLAIDELTRQFSNAVYFPAYELVIDEFRDYRFYKEDMVHPTDVAVSLVWSRFTEFCFTTDTIEIAKKAEQYHRMDAHTSIHPETPEHQEFLVAKENYRNQLISQYPFLQL